MSSILSKHPDPLMTIKDLVEYLQTSEATIRRWQRSHGLPFERIGGERVIRYRRSKVDAWIDEQNGGRAA